jgi:hypothetical protein
MGVVVLHGRLSFGARGQRYDRHGYLLEGRWCSWRVRKGEGLQPGLDILIGDHLSRQYLGSHPEPWWEIGETHIVQRYIVRVVRIVA